MVQGKQTPTNPIDPLLGPELSKPIKINESPDPSNESGPINVCAVFNYENESFYLNDRVGRAGTYVPPYSETSEGGYEAIENPDATDDVSNSSGFVMKAGTNKKTYDGDVIHCRLDLIESGGKDPMAVKQPRRSFLTASQDRETESASEVSPRVSVHGDFGQTLLTDSSNISFQQTLTTEEIYWQATDGINGRRVGHIIEDSSSASFIIESYESEVRVLGRR